jgi:hypothetical protein
MLKPYQVDQVKQLATQGISQRAISRITGVSRGSVHRILTHRRPDYGAIRVDREGDVPPFGGPPRRCPGCGALVHMPCLACRIRALIVGSKVA